MDSISQDQSNLLDIVKVEVMHPSVIIVVVAKTG